MDRIIRHLKIHFDMSFDMLYNLIDHCPDGIWNKKNGGFVFWQQLLHAFGGLEFWTRRNKGPFAEPFSGRKLYPELDNDPEGILTKNELKEYAEKVRDQKDMFFKDRTDEWLAESNVLFEKILNIDIIEMQIRHMQYHTGHCNCILREKGVNAVEWMDYFGQ